MDESIAFLEELTCELS